MCDKSVIYIQNAYTHCKYHNHNDNQGNTDNQQQPKRCELAPVVYGFRKYYL